MTRGRCRLKKEQAFAEKEAKGGLRNEGRDAKKALIVSY